MLKNTKSYFETILVSIFFIIIFFTANSFLGWGYDEYGAVVSHLELDDQRFIDEYIKIIASLGFSDAFVSIFILPIISIFIVPIRWTYGLGLSPIYSIIRFDIFSWSSVKLILIFAHTALACIGIKLLITSIKDTKTRRSFFTSSAFIYFIFKSLHLLVRDIYFLLLSYFLFWSAGISGAK